MGFFNRTMVAGAEGPLLLSVPLAKGRDQRTAVKDIEVVGGKAWKTNHWRTLTSCYNRSPWFEFYRDELADLFQGEEKWLVDWNLKCFEWLLPKLELDIHVLSTDSFNANEVEGKVEDLRGKFHRNKPQVDDGPLIRYRQVFEDRTGFIPGLSILDLLFCEGPNAGRLVKTAGRSGLL